LRVCVLKLFSNIFLFVLILLVFACKKDHTVLGTDVQPNVDGLNADHAAGQPVYGHTLKYDSIISYNTKYKYIGSNDDPYFGRTDIGLGLNACLEVVNLDFGSTATLTTAEIILIVDNIDYMGDANAALTYSVYPLSVPLSTATVYYSSNNRLHDKNTLLASYTTTFSVYNNKPAIRIPLDVLYGSAMLNNEQYLTNNSAFQAQYKGFYITASVGSGEGVIFRADLEDDLSGLYLRYKTGNLPTDTVQSYRFAFKGSTASLNSVKYNTMNFTPKGNLQNQLQGDTSLGAANLYLKGMGVTKAKVWIPFFKNYTDSFDVAVNRAEVVFYVDPAFTSGGRYIAPPKLSLLPLDSLGREIASMDQRNTIDFGRYNGNYDAASNSYVFNIARHAQAIFKGQMKNYGFNLVVADPEIPTTIRRDNYMERIILAGSNNPSLKPRLNLSFVKFKND
jgi:hypothetical protein